MSDGQPSTWRSPLGRGVLNNLPADALASLRSDVAELASKTEVAADLSVGPSDRFDDSITFTGIPQGVEAAREVWQHIWDFYKDLNTSPAAALLGRAGEPAAKKAKLGVESAEADEAQPPAPAQPAAVQPAAAQAAAAVAALQAAADSDEQEIRISTGAALANLKAADMSAFRRDLGSLAASAKVGVKLAGPGPSPTNAIVLRGDQGLLEKARGLIDELLTLHVGGVPGTNSTNSSNYTVWKCSACKVDCQGGSSYLQHVRGSKHLKKTSGKAFGFLVGANGYSPGLIQGPSTAPTPSASSSTPPSAALSSVGSQQPLEPTASQPNGQPAHPAQPGLSNGTQPAKPGLTSSQQPEQPAVWKGLAPKPKTPGPKQQPQAPAEDKNCPLQAIQQRVLAKALAPPSSKPAGAKVPVGLLKKWLGNKDGGAGPAAAGLQGGAAGAGKTVVTDSFCTIFKCAACRVDCAGEISFLSHVRGKRHLKATNGKLFAGLLPVNGKVPPLSAHLKKELLDAGNNALASAVAPGAKRLLENQVFRCKACRVSCAGEISFLQHIKGKAHLAITGGVAFAGLLPDPKTGEKAVLSEDMKMRLADIFHLGAEPVRVTVSREADEALQSALAAATKAFKQVEDAPEDGRRGDSGSRRKREKPPPQPWAPPCAGFSRFQEARKALPAYKLRSELIEAISNNAVVVVEGDTGSGKTTQVPQYVLEDAAWHEKPCSIICTQPRRISALSVAERVAEERGEKCGGTVGYSIRLESRTSAHTQMLFVTTGVLLRRLESDPDLAGTTHVFVDEVHERSYESDFLLLALKAILQRRKGLHVVLMSATIDVTLFARYFGGAPIVQVPGRTFPVKTLWLEDALDMTGHVYSEPKHVATGKTSEDKSVNPSEPEDFSNTMLQERYGSYSKNVWQALQAQPPDALDYELLTKLICGAANGDPRLNGESWSGAILVFLSGSNEILTLQKSLLATPTFSEKPWSQWVLPLHGTLTSQEQRWVFEHPPEGVRKVVLATNVAETSITIDDVSLVIDSARMKEMRFDPQLRLSSLQDCPASRANLRQRRGRAGRVSAGVALHLITKHRHDALIEEHQDPEVRRVPLEQLILRIHAMNLPLVKTGSSVSGLSSADVCSQLIQPPESGAVEQAQAELERIEAIAVDREADTETLTPLGRHLSRLPTEVRIGKLILLGATFGPEVLDHALTIAASLSQRSIFVQSLALREKADQARRKFAEPFAQQGLGMSDHLATLSAYSEVDSMLAPQRTQFMRDNILDFKVVQSMGALKRQLLESLSEAGFVRSGLRSGAVESGARRAGSRSDGVRIALMGREAKGPRKLSVEQGPLLAALLCAALFPQVARVDAPEAGRKASKKRKVEGTQSARISVQTGGEEVEAKIHPSSAASGRIKPGFLVFHELVRTSALYVRGVTSVPPLALALFGGALQFDSHEDGTPRVRDGPQGREVLLTVDHGWIQMLAPARTLAALSAVREQLDSLLRRRLSAPDWSAAGAEAALLRAVVQLLECEMDDD